MRNIPLIPSSVGRPSGIIPIKLRFEVSAEPLAIRDPFALIPPEISLHIISYLDPESVLSCYKVSKLWRCLCNCDSVWSGLCDSLKCERKFVSENPQKSPCSVKSLFLSFYAVFKSWKQGSKKCQLQKLKGHKEIILAVMFDEHWRRIFTGCRDGKSNKCP